MRANRYACLRIPLFVWVRLCHALLLLLSLPGFGGCYNNATHDRNFNTAFLMLKAEEILILFQHLFGSLVIRKHTSDPTRLWYYQFSRSRLSRKDVSGIVEWYSHIIAIGHSWFLSWAHHMFTVGLDIDTRALL